MEALSSAIRLVQRNLLRDPGYLYRYLRRYFDPDYRPSVPFMSDDDLLTRLYRGKSMIRLGDGEIHLINYGNSTYQDYHPRLRAYLLRIIRGYDAETGVYLLGLPKEFLGKPNRELKDLHMLRIWLPSKIAFERLFPHRQRYFDAHLFYRDGAFARTLEPILRSHRTVVVTNPDHIARLKETGVGRRLSARFVSCAPRNAFNRFDELLVRILSLVEPGQERQYRVLLVAGPASKALAYELGKRGIASYDLGRGIETVYGGTLEHEIYGKYKPTP